MEHHQLVSALVKPAEEIKNGMTSSKANLIHATMGISGEAGELLDAVKKHVIYNKDLDRHNVIEEMGDLEFYMEQMRQELNITRDEVLEHNIAKLSKRYASLSYSDVAAQQRADKQ